MLSGPTQIFDGDARKTNSTALHEVGTLGVTTDGRKFRYIENAATELAPGKLCVAATQTANHENIAVASAVAVGETEVTVTLGATAATANDYAGGYMVVNDEAGEGIAYRITGHPAADASASLKVTLDPTEPIKVALTTSSQVSLVKNPWKDVVISVADQLDLPVGIPTVTIPASYYGWVQTHGVCAALADETLAVGADLTIGSSVVGALEAADAAGEPVVGKALQAGVDTEYRAVYLTID